MTAVRRTMVADFDSVAQRRAFERLGHRAAWARLTAQLRTADLLSEELLLTDAQLLDGAFFLLLGPDGVADLTGRSRSEPLSLVIVSRHESLQAAAALMTAGDAFVSSAEPVAGLLQELGRCSDGAERLRAGRAEWADAQAQGRVEVRTYCPKDFPLERALDALGPPPASVPGALADQLAKARTRSEAVRITEASVRDGHLPASVADTARWWWEQAYAAALADQHDAMWLAFGEPRADERDVAAPPQATGRGRSLRLDGSMVSTMSELPSAVFALVRYRARPATVEWSTQRDARSLRSIALVVRESTDAAPTWRSHYRSTAVRTALLTAAALLALAAILVPGMQAWVAIPVITALVAEIPWSDIRILVHDRPSTLQGVVHLPEAST